MAKSTTITSEFKAIQTALEVLEPLDETQRKFAIGMILSRLGVEAPQASPTARLGGSAVAAGGSGAQGDIKQQSPKEFLRWKRPITDLQRFICLAFYLANVKDTVSFSTAEITALNTEAAGSKFSNAATTANNGVHQSGFLSQAGGGKKQLTPLGEDVVAALPDQEAVSRVIADAPKKRKTKASKGKAHK